MRKAKDHDFGMKHGHAPVADKVVLIDFDDTIVPWGPLINEEAGAHDGAVDAINAIAKMGYRVVYFTSRMSPTWLHAANEKRSTQYDYVRRTVRRLGLPDGPISCEKVPAEFYIDDKAIEFTPKSPNWPAIVQRIIDKQEEKARR